MTDYDVVVLGSGLAGTCAALEAADQGARVLVAEAEEKPGGRSQFSTGMIMGAGTRFQRDRGIEDSAESLFRHYLTLNQWNHVTSKIGAVAAGKTPLCIDLGYDQPGGNGTYRGYVDDISLTG